MFDSKDWVLKHYTALGKDDLKTKVLMSSEVEGTLSNVETQHASLRKQGTHAAFRPKDAGLIYVRTTVPPNVMVTPNRGQVTG